MDQQPPELSISAISNILSETQSPRRGVALPALLTGTIEAVHNGEVHQPLTGDPSIDTTIMRVVNEGQLSRIEKAASLLMEIMDMTNNRSLTYQDLRQNPLDYGLASTDIRLIDQWQGILEQYQAKVEAKYHTLRPEELNKKVAQYLSHPGNKGIWIESDIAALKIFNTYHPELYGDVAILKTVNSLQEFIKTTYGVKLPMLFSARKGDSTYVFIPGADNAEETTKLLNQFLTNKREDMSLAIKGAHNQNGQIVLPICLYHQAVAIHSPKEFDLKRSEIAETIEKQKIDVMVKTAKYIDQNSQSPLDELALLLQYISEKRIPKTIIDSLLISSQKAQEELAAIARVNPDEEIVNLVDKLSAQNNVSDRLHQILEQVAHGGPPPTSSLNPVADAPNHSPSPISV